MGMGDRPMTGEKMFPALLFSVISDILETETPHEGGRWDDTENKEANGLRPLHPGH